MVFLGDDDQAAFHELGVVVLGEDAGQRPPARGGIAQAEALADLAGDAALLEVLDRLGRVLELAAAGLFEHVGEAGLLVLLRGLALAFGGTDVLLWHLQADLVREFLHGLDEAHARVFHQKADGVAVLATPEAVIELLARADREGWRLLAVERAQAHEVGAAFSELDVAAHDVDHVDAGQKLLDE